MFKNNTVKKVALLGVVLVPIIATYLLAQEEDKAALVQYGSTAAIGSAAILGLAVTDFRQKEPIFKFPDDFDRRFHNGFMANLDGGRFCKIEDQLFTPNECDTFASAFPDFLCTHYEDLCKSLHRNRLREGSVGFLVQDNSGTHKISIMSLGANPNMKVNFKKVLKYAEKTVLNDDGFFNKETGEILKFIHTAHEILFENIKLELGEIHPGKYRDFRSLVTRGLKGHDISSFLQEAIDSGGKKADPKTFAAIEKKFTSAIYMDDLLNSLTEQEEAFVKKYIGYITPKTDEIPKLMEDFAKKVQELGKKIQGKEIDPIEAAANVHMDLVQIHPFFDGNGRMARLWMNLFLQLGGYQAVAFDSDEDYTDAVNGGTAEFKEFLENTIKLNGIQKG